MSVPRWQPRTDQAAFTFPRACARNHTQRLASSQFGARTTAHRTPRILTMFCVRRSPLSAMAFTQRHRIARRDIAVASPVSGHARCNVRTRFCGRCLEVAMARLPVDGLLGRSEVFPRQTPQRAWRNGGTLPTCRPISISAERIADRHVGSMLRPSVWAHRSLAATNVVQALTGRRRQVTRSRLHRTRLAAHPAAVAPLPGLTAASEPNSLNPVASGAALVTPPQHGLLRNAAAGDTQ